MVTWQQLDAVTFLEQQHPESIDLLLTDPAYQSLERHRAKGTTTRLSQSAGSSNVWFETFPNERFGAFFVMAYRALRPERYALVLCDDETAGVIQTFAEAAGFYWWANWTWVKVKLGRGDDEREGEAGAGDVRSGMSYHGRKSTERIVVLEKRSKRCVPVTFPALRIDPAGKGRQLNDRGHPDVFFYPRVQGEGTYPTTKPHALGVKLIELMTQPGEVVCDPFAGSGWAGAAAQATGRQAWLADTADLSIEHLTRRFQA